MSETDGREKTPMNHLFEQQDPALGFSMPKSCATPQHGKQPDRKEPAVKEKLKENRSFQPRPGH